jgi:hypothetical protein
MLPVMNRFPVYKRNTCGRVQPAKLVAAAAAYDRRSLIASLEGRELHYQSI